MDFWLAMFLLFAPGISASIGYRFSEPAPGTEQTQTQKNIQRAAIMILYGYVALVLSFFVGGSIYQIWDADRRNHAWRE